MAWPAEWPRKYAIRPTAVAQVMPPSAFHSRNERQCMRVPPASQDAHTRRPSRKRPKNTALGPWRSKKGSPTRSTSSRWR